MSRKQFAKIVQPLLERIAGPIGKALRDGDCLPDDVDEVILVGGATRMTAPCATFCASGSWSIRWSNSTPTKSSALARPYRQRIDRRQPRGRRHGDDRRLPSHIGRRHRQGTRIADQVGLLHADHSSQHNHPHVEGRSLLDRSSPISRQVQIDVYQGEHRRVEKNLKLGELVVSNIPPGPAGQEIYIRFTYDLNGLIEVEAYAGSTGEKFSTVLTQHASELSRPTKCATRSSGCKHLKYYPREDMAVQKLLATRRTAGWRSQPLPSAAARRCRRFSLEQCHELWRQASKVEGAQQTLLHVLSMLGYEEPEQ